MYKKLLLILLVVACNKNKFTSPEAVLHSYLNYAFTHPMPDPKEMANFLVGPLYDEYLGMDEEELTALQSGRYRNYSVRILSKKCPEADHCNLTYRLLYDLYGDTKEFGIELRKMAEIRKSGELWKIADIETNRMVLKSAIPIKVDASSK